VLDNGHRGGHDGRVSAEDFEQFRQRVTQSGDLQRALRGLDEWDEFTRAVTRESSALGLVVAPEDIEEARRLARRAWLQRWIP
jgi:hypothetical protein